MIIHKYEADKNTPYVGESYPMKVGKTKRVKFPAGDLTIAILARRGKHRLSKCGGLYKRAIEEEEVVAEIVESVPKDNFEEYTLVRMHDSGNFALPIKAKIQPGDYVKFIGDGDRIKIAKTKKPTEKPRKRNV